jgi:hypothetical protein
MVSLLITVVRLRNYRRKRSVADAEKERSHREESGARFRLRMGLIPEKDH